MPVTTNHRADWRRVHPGSLALWSISTFVAGTSVLVFSSLLRLGLNYDSPLDVLWIFALLGAAGGLLGGLFAGFCQYRTLRHRAPWVGRWMPATTLGWTLGGSLFVSLNWVLFADDRIPVLVSSLLPVVVGAAAIGVGQWLFLTRRVPNAAWWIVATLFAWFLGLIVGALATMILSAIFVPTPETALLVLAPVWLLTACVVGFVTSVAMTALLSQSPTENPSFSR